MRNLVKRRKAASDKTVSERLEEYRTIGRERRQQYKRNKADKERKIMLIGEAVLRRVEQGEWDADDFRGMMDTALSHREDRELFDLD